MKLLLRIFLILIFPLILIGGINYWVDPDYSLKNNYISPLVDSLLKGEMVSGPVNINSRLFKKQWLARISVKPDMLVLGSSRTLALSKRDFPGHKFFNASVTNCTIEDMYAFLYVFERRFGTVPDSLVICADQWLFGNSFEENQWLVNRRETLEMQRRTGIYYEERNPSKWGFEKEWVKELFSVKYLLRSVRYPHKTERFEVCQAVDPQKMMFLPDGSRNLPKEISNPRESKIVELAVDYFYLSNDERFSSLDNKQCRLFEGLINYLACQNCKIILFVPPYNPQTYRLMKNSEQTTGIFEVENYLRNLGEKYYLKVIGATNPAQLDLNSFDFYDAVHLKPGALTQLFER